jgi:hypothetical protein
MDENNIRTEIEKCCKRLQNKEDVDYNYLSTDLKELRHWIMYVHLTVELVIQGIMAYNIFKIPCKKNNARRMINNFKRVIPIFDNMEFYPKVKAIQALNLLPKDLVDLIFKINDHRKYFSHPATYGGEINKYKKPEKQLQTLKELEKVLSELDEYLIKNKLVFTD